MSKDARERMAELIEEKYGKLIMKIAFDLMGDYESAEEIKQEVIYNCAQKYKTLERLYEGQMHNYVTRAAKNTSVNWKKKRDKEVERHEKYLQENASILAIDYVDFKAFEEKYEFSESTVELLASLDPTEREILLLKYYIIYEEN